MIERLVYTIVKTHVDILKATPGLVAKLFTDQGLISGAEAALIEAAFLKEPPNVIHGFGRSDNKFPLYGITLASDGPSQSVLGNEGGFDDDPDSPDFGTDEYGAIRALTINIMVYAQHPDVVLYLWEILRAGIFASLPILQGEPALMHGVEISGADMAPDPQWVPAGLFVRRVTLSGKYQYTQVLDATKLGRAFKVQGIHIDAQGAVGEDVGGVKTQVTVAEGEDE